MAKSKKQDINENNNNEKLTQIQCTGKCKQIKPLSKFFKSNKIEYEDYDNRCTVCKECLREMNYSNGQINIEGIKQSLEFLDKPFLWDVYYKVAKSKWDLGSYTKQLNCSQYKGMTFKDSDSDESKKEETMKDSHKNINNEKEQNLIENNYDIDKLKEKYGYGYPDEEYVLFEKKYQQLRPSVKILTTMHDEFFREYCVDKVKETLAKSKGDFKEAKEWASMAKDASTAGKLNPNQMSKADLSGGMDTFGQMTRMVEETPKGELLKILPKFIEKPKDKVDVVLWLYINYVRDLKGLPECEYKEIYNFYEVRNQSYEQQMLDNELSKDKNGDDNG